MDLPTQNNEFQIADTDDVSWAARSKIWAGRAAQSILNFQKSARPASLILAGQGASLRLDGGSLLVKNGLTHFPQKKEVHRFFKGAQDIPKRIIILDGSGCLTFDVLSWLAEQDVALIRIDWRGNVVCVASRIGYSANPFRVRWQRETRENPELRLEFAVGKITEKIEKSIVTLEKRCAKMTLGTRP